MVIVGRGVAIHARYETFRPSTLLIRKIARLFFTLPSPLGFESPPLNFGSRHLDEARKIAERERVINHCLFVNVRLLNNNPAWNNGERPVFLSLLDQQCSPHAWNRFESFDKVEAHRNRGGQADKRYRSSCRIPGKTDTSQFRQLISRTRCAFRLINFEDHRWWPLLSSGVIEGYRGFHWFRSLTFFWRREKGSRRFAESERRKDNNK